MDVNSGWLVADIDQVPQDLRHLFTPVPKNLQADARRRLDGEREVIVSRQEDSRLAQWAAKKRAKSRMRNKQAKRARKAAKK